MSHTDARAAMLDSIATHVRSALAPQVHAIDAEGHYPAEFLHELGTLGGFAAAIDVENGGTGLGLAQQVAITTLVGQQCGSTAFLVWCQAVCAWYLQNSPNAAVRERYLKPVAQGALLAGTGMSNTVKHLAGIEKIHLRAKREEHGYVVTGALPWVSNLRKGHLAIVAAAVEGEGYIMFAISADTEGLSLRPCLEFSGLNGTQTLGMRFTKVHVPTDNVLAHPDQFSAYIRKIKPGFVLAQTGMGFGISDSCLNVMRDSNTSNDHVNQFLDDQEPELTTQLIALKANVADLAVQAESNSADLLDILKIRLAVSELTLAAAHSAVLHAGAKGYLMMHPAQRNQREAVFVAIVTPALKHLRKEIHDLELQRQHGANEQPVQNAPDQSGAKTFAAVE